MWTYIKLSGKATHEELMYVTTEEKSQEYLKKVVKSYQGSWPIYNSNVKGLIQEVRG